MIAILILAGAAILAVGAEAVISGAEGLALGFGISQEVIGLTLVGFGTTVPEMTVAITGSRKGQSEVVLGNIVGTIVVNSLFILGLGAMVGGYNTSGLETAVGMAVMIAISTSIVLMLAAYDRGGKRLGLALIGAYTGYLVLMTLL